VVTPRPTILAAVVALAGCTVSHEVLHGDDLPVTTCDQVWESGAPGDPCTLTAPCTREDPTDPMCCTAYAYCRMGELVMDTTCNPDCSSCIDDHSCVEGAAICLGMTCEPCPSDPGGQTCPPCPPGWINLTRNGCETCECSPPGECTLPGPDGNGGCQMDPNGEQCYPGARFADPGCAPDDAGCVANVCSAPGCTSPAPLGCFTSCDATMPTCSQCATTSCECDPATGTWSCLSICIDDTPQSLTCFL
jgi:hypothetical protein